MPAGRPHVSPRHLAFLFVGITMALAAVLVWLGVQLVRQDRALETQRTRDGLERVVMTTSAALERGLAGVQDSVAAMVTTPAAGRRARLRDWAGRLAAGAIVLDVTGSTMHALPDGVLRFDPLLVPPVTLSPQVFSSGERLEFRDENLAAAAAAYRGLSRHDDPGIRAGALLRLGRVLRKLGVDAEALAVYAQLAALDTLALDGVPVGLTAGHARVVLLDQLSRGAESRAEAARLLERLHTSHWRLTRSSYEYHAGTLHLLSGARSAPPTTDEAFLLTLASDSLLLAWPGPGDAGRTIVAVDSVPMLVVWNARGGTRVAFVATPEHLARTWLAPLQEAAAREGVTVVLTDGAGRTVFGHARTDASPRVTRPALESRLPWTVSAQTSDPLARSADLSARRRILLIGLVVAVLLVMVGFYAVARAVNRELAVARLQSDFVSAVSHEFRTPLTSLRQVTELLSSGRLGHTTNRDQYHDILLRETGRLQRLVENLLDFGRLEAGALEFRFEPLRPEDVVVPLVDEFRQEAAAEGRVVSLDLSDVGTISADREALTRAVRNLLDNAAKYSPGGRDIAVSVARQGGRIAVTVRDHGMGIPRDEQETIFGQFSRGRHVRSSGIPGTGIGLAMVRRIVRAHGGEVRLASTVGEGSTFTILLRPAES